jgi:arsenate reductase
MAEGFLKSFDPELEVYSGGTSPSSEVHPKAIDVMGEIDIDISDGKPQHADDFVDMDFDYVITVCGDAKETCPVFIGNVKNHLHIGFEDPAKATGTEEEIYQEFRRIREEIKKDFSTFYKNIPS